MKDSVKRPERRLNKKAISLIAAIMLALPISASMLCISPSGHVSIESLNADCCALPGIAAYEKHTQNDAVHAQDECLNCTDLPLLSNEPGTIQRCYFFSAAGASADEPCQGLLEGAAATRSLLQKERLIFIISPPATSPVPLRC